MGRSKQTRYSQEFKAQAVRMAIHDGIGVAETARRLSICSKTQANWVTQAKQASRGDGEKAESLVFLQVVITRGFRVLQPDMEQTERSSQY